ncbi:MAG: hypothetical protein HYR51_12475 [Candidatus Rokubacteria bacterium]|nr:hypothetical protein [Candidatus Rokubacteria bacterium]
MKSVVGRIARFAAVALVLSACAGTGLRPTAEVTSTVPSWQNWFKLDWALDPESGARRRITGYVYNEYGEAAYNVQLLTQALDKAGAVVHQRIDWAGGIPPMSRSYFEVRNLPPAEQYRVTVWAFDFRQGNTWP